MPARPSLRPVAGQGFGRKSVLSAGFACQALLQPGAPKHGRDTRAASLPRVLFTSLAEIVCERRRTGCRGSRLCALHAKQAAFCEQVWASHRGRYLAVTSCGPKRSDQQFPLRSSYVPRASVSQASSSSCSAKLLRDKKATHQSAGSTLPLEKCRNLF